jgi:hypothetical protein
MSIVDLSDKALLTTGADYWSTHVLSARRNSCLVVGSGSHS